MENGRCVVKRLWQVSKDLWEYVVVKKVVNILFEICHRIGLSEWAYKLATQNI
jgi:hypothetical protein